MSVINLTNIITESLDLENVCDQYYKDLPYELNFNNVEMHMTEGSLILPPHQKTKHVDETKTKVTFRDKNKTALAIVRASVESGFKDRIIIQRGVIKGLRDARINIPLDGTYLSEFATIKTIDLSKPVSEEALLQQVSAVIEVDIDHKNTSAIVVCPGLRHTVVFQCEVTMNGIVPWQKGLSVGQIELAEAIQLLKANHPESVIDLRVFKNNVEFTVTGEMEFRRPGQPIIEWKGLN